MASALTPEEKKALKAAKKEEKKRQAQELVKQQQRDYLGRELKYGALTLKRHEKRWRAMMIKLALPKMREDLEFAWHNFERVVDCKNFTISLLMDAVRESEQQHMLSVRNHIENIDKLMGLLHERFEELQEDYKNEIADLQKKSEEEIEKLNLSAREEEIYYKTIIFNLQKLKKHHEHNVRTEFFTKFDERELKQQRYFAAMRDVLDKRLDLFTNNLVNFLKGYENQTRERQKAHDMLKTQDDDLQGKLLDQLEQIRKACDYLNILKINLVDSREILGRKLKDIQIENDFFELAFSTLKKQLEVDRKKDIQQMTLLTVIANETLEFMEDLRRTKIMSIVQLSTLCRKLETEKEKVLPYPVVHTEHSHEEGHLPELNLFWQRVGQAAASKYSLNEEKECLKKENEVLLRNIYEYCQCVTCPVPNKNIVQRNIRHITEGALEMKKYQKQNGSQFHGGGCHFDIDE